MRVPKKIIYNIGVRTRFRANSDGATVASPLREGGQKHPAEAQRGNVKVFFFFFFFC